MPRTVSDLIKQSTDTACVLSFHFLQRRHTKDKLYTLLLLPQRANPRKRSLWIWELYCPIASFWAAWRGVPKRISPDVPQTTKDAWRILGGEVEREIEREQNKSEVSESNLDWVLYRERGIRKAQRQIVEGLLIHAHAKHGTGHSHKHSEGRQYIMFRR